MFLPSWNKRMTTNSYASLHRRSLHICKFLGSIPSDQLQYAEVPFWNNIQTPLPKHTWDMHIIAIVYGILKAETASMLVTKTDKKNLRKKFLRQSGKSIASITTPTPLPLVMEKTQALIKYGSFLETTFIKQDPNIKQVPWTDLTALTKQPNNPTHL